MYMYTFAYMPIYIFAHRHMHTYGFLFALKMGFHYVVLASLELYVDQAAQTYRNHLFLPSKCWDSRCIPPSLSCMKDPSNVGVQWHLSLI